MGLDVVVVRDISVMQSIRVNHNPTLGLAKLNVSLSFEKASGSIKIIAPP